VDTRIDTFAVALGSVQGLKTRQISLDLDRLDKIRERLSVPLVLHGSSGVSDEDIKHGIAMGLCKVNVATQLSQAFTGAVRDVLGKDKELVDPRKYLAEGRAAQSEMVSERIRFPGAPW
jgi:fructose/tagatose bisphosphate aldolase